MVSMVQSFHDHPLFFLALSQRYESMVQTILSLLVFILSRIRFLIDRKQLSLGPYRFRNRIASDRKYFVFCRFARSHLVSMEPLQRVHLIQERLAFLK